MELHQLEAFEAVAAYRSFTKAADALFITQPAVTRQIAALETELRTRLFDRMGRTVRLTHAGEALHQYAESILRLTHEARQAVGDIEAGHAGRLAVGASNTLATYVLPPLLRRFRKEHGQVEIAVHTGTSAQVVEMVRAGAADIGLVTTVPEDPLLASVVLADYETCAVVPPGHALATRATVAPVDLAESPLILMEAGTNLRTYVDKLLSAAGVAEQVAMELDNVEAIKRMIAADLGVSLLPQVAVRDEVAAGRLVALPLGDVPSAHRQIRLTYRHDRYQTTALKAFVALLENGVAAHMADTL